MPRTSKPTMSGTKETLNASCRTVEPTGSPKFVEMARTP